MKKPLILVTAGLSISAIPLAGAFVFHNGPEWIRSDGGGLLAVSCIFLTITVFVLAFDRLLD